MKELSAEYEKLKENTGDMIKKISACDESDDSRSIVNGLNESINNEETFLEDIRRADTIDVHHILKKYFDSKNI